MQRVAFMQNAVDSDIYMQSTVVVISCNSTEYAWQPNNNHGGISNVAVLNAQIWFFIQLF